MALDSPAADDRPHGGVLTRGIAVLGVGNALCRDDGAGGLVVQALERDAHQGAGTFIDAGTIGLALLGILQDHDAVVFVDAARMGRPAGWVEVFEGEAMDRFATGKPSSVHEVSLAMLLQAAALTGALPRRRALVGIEPRDVSLGTEPSAEVREAIEPACDAVRELLRAWGSQ